MTNSSPLITVCVPTYNGAPYLEACLQSIVTQTLRDFDILVVDDCSSDDTVDIARRWTDRDPRIRVESNENNLGLVGNWNRCVTLARGVWIKFLFQDDLMAPNCLSRMLAAGEDSGGFVASSRELLFEDGSDVELRAWYEKHAAILRSLHQEGQMSPASYAAAKLKHLDLNIVGEPSATMIRRDLFERVGRFDPQLVQICDGEMWNRLALNFGLTYVSEELVTFRVHGGSASARFRENPFRGGALDPIVELNRFLAAAPFERVSSVAGRSGDVQRVRDEIERRTNGAFEAVRHAKRARGPSHAQEMRVMLLAALGSRPAYLAAQRRYALFRVRRFLGLV